MVVENIGLVPTCAISIAAILVPGNVAAFCFFFFFFPSIFRQWNREEEGMISTELHTSVDRFG